MTLRCCHPQHKICSSYWSPCSPSARPRGLQSASQRHRLLYLVAGTCTASGMWGASASSVVNMGMLYFMKTDTSSTHCSIAWLGLGSIFPRYTGLGCADSVQLLVRLQQAILQPCASNACEVWAPSLACVGPFKEHAQLQRSFLHGACHVRTSLPVDIIFQELQQMHGHNFWWRRVTSFWSAPVEAVQARYTA